MTLAALLLLAGLGVGASAVAQPGPGPDVRPRPRVIVLTDIENEPDDTMSMVRFLTYANHFEIEGLVATTSIHQKERVGSRTDTADRRSLREGSRQPGEARGGLSGGEST